MRTSRATFLVTAVSAAALGLSACAQQGQGGGMSRTGGGALLGALGGAAIGAATGEDGRDRVERGLAGAAIGGLAGGAVGAFMDSQQQELEQDLQGTGAQLVRQEETIIITVPNNVTFPFDSADLSPQGRNALADVADTLARNPNTTIDVIGHTDATGDDQYNIDLSLRRAESVMDYLVASGVSRSRIEAFGAGESQPVATNQTEQGRAQNRRVELRIDPIRANS